jgi:hypothetical protein
MVQTFDTQDCIQAGIIRGGGGTFECRGATFALLKDGDIKQRWCTTCPTHLIFLDLIILIIFGEE